MPSAPPLADLVASAMLSAEAAEFRDAAVRDGRSIVMAGLTHAGKTTLPGALGGVAPGLPGRIVVREEVAETPLAAIAERHEDVVMLKGRWGSESVGVVDRLVQEARSMTPARVVVGDVRGAEALCVLEMASAEQPVPVLCAVNAIDADGAVVKLRMMTEFAKRAPPAGMITEMIGRAAPVVVEHGQDRLRCVTEMTEIAPGDMGQRPQQRVVRRPSGTASESVRRRW